MSQDKDYEFWDWKHNKLRSKLTVRIPNGYCVHKISHNKHGLITKIELFGYFAPELEATIKAKAAKLEEAKKNVPGYFHIVGGKYITLFRKIVQWNKSAVLIRAYTQNKKRYLKLEVTRMIYNGKNRHGRKFLSPVQTLNSLGNLICYLTDDAKPLQGITHSKFFYADEFLSICKKQFKEHNLKGQLREMDEQKLRNNLKFGFKRKRKRHF